MPLDTGGRMTGLWLLSLCLLFLSPVLVVKAWLWTLDGVSQRVSSNLVVFLVATLVAALVAAALVRLGAWVLTQPMPVR